MTTTITPRRGPSSYHMQNSDLVFEGLGLTTGNVLLDLGCGAGEYALRAAEIVGTTGRVHAMDINDRSTRLIAEDAERRGLVNVLTHVGDMRALLPFDDESMDVCLIAQALHALPDHATSFPRVFAEAFRILRGGGTLAIIECEKEDAPFGPPLSARLAPEDLTPVAEAAGFTREAKHAFGASYLQLFRRSER